MPVFPENAGGASDSKQLRKAPSAAPATRNEGASGTLLDAALTVFPNPFSTSTTIRFELQQTEQVQLEVYNLQGQRVRLLQSAELDAGVHEVRWDEKSGAGIALESGLYLVRLQAGDSILIKKVSLMW